MSVRPIFIFSAPRSGSTLLQRALASHPAVATTSEPWILLPLLSPLAPPLPAEGGRDSLVRVALTDLAAELPAGADDYRAAVRGMALQLYERLTPPPATHFVDKTPMYHLIVDEIVRTFPDGLFVFLFRNPLSVLASSIEMFDGGRWEPSRYHMALFQSWADLAPASERHSARSFKVRYEDLVAGGDGRWRELFDHLGLSWQPEILSGFAEVRLQGRMGDQTGAAQYSTLSAEPLAKWRSTVANPVRRAWCVRYLRWLGRERLAVMGYDLDELLAALAETGRGHRHALDDVRLLAASFARDVIRARVPPSMGRASTWNALLRARPAGSSRPGEPHAGERGEPR